MDDEVEHTLRNSGVQNEILMSSVFPYLAQIGIKSVNDLEFLTFNDIDQIEGK